MVSTDAQSTAQSKSGPLCSLSLRNPFVSFVGLCSYKFMDMWGFVCLMMVSSLDRVPRRRGSVLPCSRDLIHPGLRTSGPW